MKYNIQMLNMHKREELYQPPEESHAKKALLTTPSADKNMQQ